MVEETDGCKEHDSTLGLKQRRENDMIFGTPELQKVIDDAEAQGLEVEVLYAYDTDGEVISEVFIEGGQSYWNECIRDEMEDLFGYGPQDEAGWRE